MDKPVVAGIHPIKVSLKKDKKYLYCTCGRSKSQPFCDGSHAGTRFLPKLVTVNEDRTVFLCMCKHSKNIPFCDGTHEQFNVHDIGKAL